MRAQLGAGERLISGGTHASLGTGLGPVEGPKRHGAGRGSRDRSCKPLKGPQSPNSAGSGWVVRPQPVGDGDSVELADRELGPTQRRGDEG
jgi:hypothetical protein